MNNWGYREIFGFDTRGLKQLNDTLMALWAKVMGERTADGKAHIAGAEATLEGKNAARVISEGYVTLHGAGVQPMRDNATDLGGPTLRWNNIYARTAAISTSDAREKQDVKALSGMERFIRLLRPVRFRFKDGHSGREHFGLIAQEVKEAMRQAGIDDFGGLVRAPRGAGQAYREDLPESEVCYGLRYEEFIAPLIAYVQTLEARVAALEAGRRDQA